MLSVSVMSCSQIRETPSPVREESVTARSLAKEDRETIWEDLLGYYRARGRISEADRSLKAHDVLLGDTSSREWAGRSPIFLLGYTYDLETPLDPSWLRQVEDEHLIAGGVTNTTSRHARIVRS